MLEGLLNLSNDSISFSHDTICIVDEVVELNNSKNQILGLSRSFSSSSSSLSKQVLKCRDVLALNLDISRISDRILVASKCNNKSKDSGARNQSEINDLERFADFLNNKYRDKYMIWNIGTLETLVPTTVFNNHRIIPCVLPKSQNHTLKSLFHLCHAMTGWLSLNTENVVIIQCNNGWRRSGLLVSCLLKFTGALDSAFEALNIFQSRRIKSKHPAFVLNLVDNQVSLRYLRYFSDIVNAKGRVLNASPLYLHQMIISSIPNFDGNGSCNPGLEIFQNNELLLSTSAIADKSLPSSDVYVFKDDFNIIFKMKENSCQKDLQIHVFHSNPKTGQRTTIFSYTFNSAFFNSGVVRLKADDLEIPLKDSPPPPTSFSLLTNSHLKRFKETFSVDLIILPASPSENHQQDTLVDYISTCKNNYAKNLLRLSQMHPIKPDPKLLAPLILQSFPKFYAKLALQLYANDIHLVHEFLEKLKLERNGFADMERSFLELTGKNVEIPEVSTETDQFSLKDENIKAVGAPLPSFSGIGIKKIVNIFLDKNEESQIPEASNSNNNDNNTNDNDGESVIPLAPPLPSLVNIPPAPPLPFINAAAPPPPPPLPNFKINSNNNSLIPPAPPLPAPNSNMFCGSEIERPKIKNTLRWNVLQDEDCPPDPKSPSVWHEIASGELESKLELDTERFEELFCIDSNGAKHLELKRRNSLKDFESTTILPVVIDIRRANNVGIGLARFGKRFESFEEIISKGIFEDDSLDLEDYLALKSIIPTEEEAKNLKLIKRTDEMLMERMGQAEKFMHFVSTATNQIDGVIEYKCFELSCWQEAEGLQDRFEGLSQILDNLRMSGELKIVLKATLDLGNLATFEYGRYNHKIHRNSNYNQQRRESAFGFTIDSLCRLHEVKSVDGKSNLLTFLVDSLSEAHPEVLEIPKREEFRDLDLIKGWSHRSLQAEFRDLQSKTKKFTSEILAREPSDFWIRAKEKMETFESLLEKVEKSSEGFESSWELIKIYFGQVKEVDLNDSDECAVFSDASQFLTTIWMFFKNFEAAVRQVRQVKRQPSLSLKSGSSSTSSEDQEIDSSIMQEDN